MRVEPEGGGSRRTICKNVSILLILAAFVFFGFQRAMQEDGDDLSASFVGCRLFATGESSHLYAHDPQKFSDIGPDSAWQEAADRGNYQAFLHPYVQTPLWAWSLRPLCTGSLKTFLNFQKLFTLLSLLSFAAAIWLVAFFWARSLFHPVAIAAVCVALWFAEPFQYSLALMQTHILFVLLSLAALMLAERRFPVAAGVCLALAATVKITPAALLLYWVVMRRWKAAASMVVASSLLWGATYLAVGPDVVHEYLVTLHRVSQVLLVSQNNQSFAAWLLARSHPAKEALGFRTFPLPGWVRLASTGGFLLCTLAGGLIDRRDDRRTSHGKPMPGATVNASRAPLGAMIALVATTIFAPIAWSHYSIILIAPVMILLHEQVRLARHGTGAPRVAGLWIAPLVLIIAGLNYRPFAAAAIKTTIYPLTLVRSHFYGEVLCLLALAAVAFTRQPAEAHSQT